jgi:mono/diheme cytochrome c family protein
LACIALAVPVGHAQDATPAQALVEQGKQLATAADCVACHSAPSGQAYAGGLALSTPLGTIVSSNITPSRTAGIGNYSLDQFSKALREGVRADGAHLYPAMPYTSYAKLNDQDVAALYAYFTHGVAAVDTPAVPTKLPFPFNLRFSMAFWNVIYLDRKPFVPSPGAAPDVAHGAYLGLALAHCDTCHTPRGFLMGQQDDRALSGGSLGTWFAPNITSDPVSGIGSWSNEELVAYLKNGDAPGKAQAAGPMAEAIDHSLRHLSDADLHDIAAWLKATPAVRTDGDTQAANTWGKPANELESLRGVALPANHDEMTGPQIYDAYCASCHQASGQGTGDGLPSLFHNTALGHGNGDNLVMAILQGVERKGYSSNVSMPAFGDHLSDRQVATLGNYLLASYGRPDVHVDVSRVAELRAGGAPSPLLALARWGMAAGVVILLLLVIFFIRRRRRA